MNLSEEHLSEISDYIYRYAFLILKNEEDAKDITQEVLYRYVARTPEFENEDAERAWNYRVCHNLSLNLRRHSWYRKRSIISEGDMDKLPNESEEDVALKVSVAQAIHQLPMKYSEVLFFYYYQEYSVPKISRITGIKENTLYSRLDRAKDLMREKMGDDFYE